MTKQIDIKELIPFIQFKGYVILISAMLNIAPAKDWTKSLIKIGDK